MFGNYLGCTPNSAPISFIVGTTVSFCCVCFIYEETTVDREGRIQTGSDSILRLEVDNGSIVNCPTNHNPVKINIAEM